MKLYNHIIYKWTYIKNKDWQIEKKNNLMIIKGERSGEEQG